MGRLSSIDNHLRARHVGVVVRGENERERRDLLGFRPLRCKLQRGRPPDP